MKPFLFLLILILGPLSTARSGDPESFPVPTQEERDQLRKSHLRIGGMSAPRASGFASMRQESPDSFIARSAGTVTFSEFAVCTLISNLRPGR